MTATEELRRMLDEAGVEWEDMSLRPYACTSWCDPDGEPCTALEGADDIPDGKLSVQALLTSEQAIAATLGSCNCSDNCTNGERTNGTCEADETDLIPFVRADSGDFEVDYIHVMECSSCGGTYEYVNGDYEYCPRCGRRVVAE